MHLWYSWKGLSTNAIIFNSVHTRQYYKMPQLMSMKSAIEGMLAGDVLYMKFNREFPKDEEVFENAINRATDVLRAHGGPTVFEALTQTVKVGRIWRSLLSLVRLKRSAVMLHSRPTVTPCTHPSTTPCQPTGSTKSSPARRNRKSIIPSTGFTCSRR